MALFESTINNDPESGVELVAVSLTKDDQLLLATEYKRIMGADRITLSDITTMLVLTKGVLDHTFYKKD
jgi:hypothetical protein